MQETVAENNTGTMKAWIVREKDEFCCAVVFAKTRGQAKSLAMSQLEDCEYRFLEAHRLPEADKYYNGSGEQYCLNWELPDDRLFLVKEFDFRCEEFMLEHCEDCSAKEYCGDYQQWLDDNEEEV